MEAKEQETQLIMFESDENYITVADIICFNMGLKLGVTARSVAEAKNLFARIANQELKPEIAIVTNFLERDANDGSQIAKKLRELLPEIKIVAYSFVADENWADKVAVKASTDVGHSLISVLSDLTHKKFKNSNNL